MAKKNRHQMPKKTRSQLAPNAAKEPQIGAPSDLENSLQKVIYKIVDAILASSLRTDSSSVSVICQQVGCPLSLSDA